MCVRHGSFINDFVVVVVVITIFLGYELQCMIVLHGIWCSTCGMYSIPAILMMLLLLLRSFVKDTLLGSKEWRRQVGCHWRRMTLIHINPIVHHRMIIVSILMVGWIFGTFGLTVWSMMHEIIIVVVTVIIIVLRRVQYMLQYGPIFG